jgi:ADP-ribosylglycohydrolase
MKPVAAFIVAALAAVALPYRLHAQPAPIIELNADVVDDKIRGGMLAQVIGNLNGLPHEFKYINQPGNVAHYTPSLPEGAVTDDDTDIEWVYLREIVRSREIFLPSENIAAQWREHINRRIFCANRYARDLMDLGIEPPWTGNVGLNPWSEFNISGQFVCESFGLMSPAMPQTAARLGIHYTRTAIDGEPAQATQLFTAMIATAFVETDVEKILDAGLAAVDPKSEIAHVVVKVRELHHENPDDWKQTRLEFKKLWQKQGGIVRERNGYELNTACVIAALLYGHQDFVETLRMAFNLGWDADCDAATAATIVGVMKGRHWMDEQHWDIKDLYRNTTRDNMPNDETLTGLENLAVEAARLTIQKNGGSLEPSSTGKAPNKAPVAIYRIRSESAKNIEPLSTAADQLARLKKQFGPQLQHELTTPGIASARAAYLAICLGDADQLKADSPAAWSTAISELEKYPAIVHDLFHSPAPLGDALRHNAERAGLHDPKNIKLTERPLE